MIRRPPRSTQSRSSAASDVYKRQASESLGIPHTPLFTFSYVLFAVANSHCWSLTTCSVVFYSYSIPYSALIPVSYTHLRAHETVLDLVCRLLLEKKKKKKVTECLI
eukprot:TRINITY_DN154_c0_g1_i9.p1 TRINITY_DN154_c0_g1~~TRINITY_DN154_c0_g1_i9.p1  ORF type:complete len:107 (-),score=47.31 TRINITY_DN154_c0_g1_i9:95-415(-)